MKHLKIFSMLLCGLTALVFTSCLNDNDDDNYLTTTEIKQAYSAVAGSHSGKVVFPAQNPNVTSDKADTLAASWNVKNDSTLTIYNLPISKLAEYVQDADLKAAIADLPDTDVDCLIGFTQQSPVTFLINPATITYNSLSYGGGSHKVQIGFYVNSINSFGVYSSSTKVMSMQILVGGIYIDGKLDTSLMQSAFPFIFGTNL